jgi:DNA-binding transcriptional ArsR family regulator
MSPNLNTTFSALSDPIRRGILQRLARGEATAGELAEPYAVTLPAISRHLRVLEQAGLLARRKSGRVHHCRLNPKPMRQAAVWIEQYRLFWEQRLDALENYLGNMENEETTQWQQPNLTPAPTTSSKSGAPSKRRAKKSSGRGRGPKK